MKPLAQVASLLCVCLLTATSAGTSQPLKMHASSLSPACLTVQLSVEPDADNRVLFVAARTGDFYRSSETDLDGARAPRTMVFQLRVPADEGPSDKHSGWPERPTGEGENDGQGVGSPEQVERSLRHTRLALKPTLNRLPIDTTQRVSRRQ